MRKTSPTRKATSRHNRSHADARKQRAPRAANQFDRLQQQHGNRTVQKLLRSGYLDALQRQAPEEEDPRLQEDQQMCEGGGLPQLLSQEAVQTTSGVQAKLTLSSPNDELELEAERVATEVSGFHKSVSSSGVGTSFLSQLSVPHVMGMMSSTQRSFHRTINAARKLQISSRSAARRREANVIAPEIESRILRSRGTGQPLPTHVQNAMALRTGYDFSAVRVKTDSEAAALNQSTHARAFTLGADIWLGKNESPHDMRLMAHELTHVVQQGAARPITTVTTAGADRSPKSSANRSTVQDYLQSLTKDSVHDPTVFAKAIDRFTATHPSDQIATLQRQILERPARDEATQKSDSTVMRACGCSGGPGGGGTAAPCAIPINYKETARSKAAGGVLHFEYSWESSTGKLSDLSSCEVGEIVTYGKIEDPPFDKTVRPNPTIIWLPGADGGLQDNHSPGLKKPFKDAVLNATQFYRVHCPCHDSDKPTNLMGPIPITREVKKKPDGKFKYTITKSGLSNEIDPLP